MKTGLKQGFKTTEKNLQEKGQVTTAQPTCDPTESRGEENRHRGGAGLQQRQTHLLPQRGQKSWGRPGAGNPGHSQQERVHLIRTDPERTEHAHFYFIYFSLENNCFPFPVERIPIKMRPLWLYYFSFSQAEFHLLGR